MRDHFDRGTVDLATATFAPDQVGRTQALTPKGFLLCSGVRIARTGPMLYRHEEVPEVKPAPDGSMTVVLRDAETLFSPETMASFAGMDVTNDHPENLITPASPRKLAVGTVMNPRRGEGVDTEYLVADLLLKDAKAIGDVQSRRKREISCGYDADVEEIKPGLGRQTRIIGNHVAIVDRGRAGPTCAIQDEEPEMATKSKFLDRLRKAFKDNDESEFNKAIAAAPEMDDGSETEEGGVHVHIHPPEAAKPAEDDRPEDPYEPRFKAIEDGVTALGSKLDAAIEAMKPAEATPETTDEAETESEKKDEEAEPDKAETMDSIAKAEIIMPGYKPPTMDGARRRTLTGMRRDVLTQAFADSARRSNVEAVVGATVDFSKMKPRELRAVFDGIAAVSKVANNAPRTRIADIPQGRMTPARLQEINAASRKRA